MSKKSRRSKQRPAAQVKARLGGLAILPYIATVLLVGAVGLPLGMAIGKASVKPLPVSPPPMSQFTPDTVDDPYPDLGHLLSMTPNQLQAVDIAVLNLDCAKGLPGAENIDVPQLCRLLDACADHVRSETDRSFHKFQENPGDYENSEAYFRALALICILEEDMGAHYNLNCLTSNDYSHVDDVMLTGLLGPNRSGTCASMPVLYIAVGRRLGYPLKLVAAGPHLFARWESPDGKVRFNIEGTNHGLSCHSDEFYRSWPVKISDDEVKTGLVLRSMPAVEELGTFLTIRGDVLQDLGRLPEAQLCYAEAHALIPPHDGFFGNLAEAVDKEKLLLAGKLDPKSPNNPFRNKKPAPYADLPPDSVGEATVVHDETVVK